MSYSIGALSTIFVNCLDIAQAHDVWVFFCSFFFKNFPFFLPVTKKNDILSMRDFQRNI